MPQVETNTLNSNNFFASSGTSTSAASSYSSSSIDIFNTQNANPANSVFGTSSNDSMTAKKMQNSLGSTDRVDREIKQAEEDAQKAKEQLATVQKEIKKLEKQISEENRADEPNENKISDLRSQITKLKGKERTSTSSYQRSLSEYKKAAREKESAGLTSGLNAFQYAANAVGEAVATVTNDVKEALGIENSITIPTSERAATLATAAEGQAYSMGGSKSISLCSKGVRLSLEKIGITGVTGASAYMAADKLAKRSDFQEITKEYPSGKSLKGLPAGAIVVWDRGVNGYSKEHGHISIALGDGREASDFVGKQGGSNYEGSTGYRVFLPA